MLWIGWRLALGQRGLHWRSKRASISLNSATGSQLNDSCSPERDRSSDLLLSADELLRLSGTPVS